MHLENCKIQNLQTYNKNNFVLYRGNMFEEPHQKLMQYAKEKLYLTEKEMDDILAQFDSEKFHLRIGNLNFVKHY